MTCPPKRIGEKVGFPRRRLHGGVHLGAAGGHARTNVFAAAKHHPRPGTAAFGTVRFSTDHDATWGRRISAKGAASMAAHEVPASHADLLDAPTLTLATIAPD